VIMFDRDGLSIDADVLSIDCGEGFDRDEVRSSWIIDRCCCFVDC
jgi:hypothetical protein